jgi:flagellar FliL protein
MPEIRDALQPFLRELRPEDLAGSAGVFRIKEEMTRRVKDRVGPDKVDDILIQDLIQQ